MPLVYLVLFFLTVGFVSWLMGVVGDRIKRVESIKADYDAKLRQRETEYREKADELEKDKLSFEFMYREKSSGFPWLAGAYSDYLELKDLRIAEILENKRRPAIRTAEALRESSKRRVKAERLWRILKYKLEYYESLFPWLVDFDGEELDDLIRQVLDGTPAAAADTDVDPVSKLLTSAEFASLSTAQKNQLALDRYLSGRKSKWEIGRDYERYIGHHFDVSGWHVQFHGILEGFADLGRDLIATKGERTVIVQCKCWSSEKQIHEKHVFQLFGSVEAYKLDYGVKDVQGLLVTSTALSERARRFADHLGIDYWEGDKLVPYPLIKCNVSHRDGTKIYHLPFDQQYDRTTIDRERRECYVQTVAEAEALGFRRVWRWHGTEDAVPDREFQTTH
jgi:hypothetical protein